MQFLVVGTDGPAFVHEPCDLHELHQNYMDGWCDELVARGPLLSPDGEQHLGSVHVVDVADETVARRFALDEPFASHGWYSELMVMPVYSCLPGTMWDRPTPAAGLQSAYVRATLDTDLNAEQFADALRRQRRGASDVGWLYLCVAPDDEIAPRVGVLGLVDLTPNEAMKAIESVVRTVPTSTPFGVDAQRWQRGGRQQQG